MKRPSTFIIAEAGVNHNGDLDTAIKLVEAAKATGADCVKFQTFKAASVITKAAPKAAYQLETTNPQESQFEMLKKLELGYEDFATIKKACEEHGIQFLSTPYNEEDADLLEKLGVDAYKIASGQLVEPAFLEHVARKGKRMIISTGMATIAEAYEAVNTIRQAGNEDIIVLQCTTNYPSPIDDANLRAMVAMKDVLGVPIGYSDHVEENYACFAAVALGATVIEKHFTLDRSMEGPDHEASLNQEGFTELVRGIRAIESALGSSIKQPTAREQKNIQGMRRSIVLNRRLEAGERIEEDMMMFKRPATGLPPRMKKELIGATAAKAIEPDMPLQFDMIQFPQS
jgi:N-acetylneuraminate synthase/N,N'-diacetyllegionaminate synthase